MLNEYNVKIDVFEGPLGLLLTMIEKRKLFIGDIALVKVADDYIEYINTLDGLPVNDVANFILVASTLILIKSKSLLPTLSLTEEEEKSIDDLEKRLRIYKKMRDLSKGVNEMFGKNIIFAKTSTKNIDPVFSPDKNTNKSSIHDAISSVLMNLPKKEIVREAIVSKIISLEEMIDNLADRMKSSIKESFNSFSKIGKSERVNVVVSFLAMLELVKQDIIKVSQDRDFDDIRMESNEVSLPNYS
jgi:segregation and condensation protein A